MARITLAKMKKDLKELARVASRMVDGELACRIIAESALAQCANPDKDFPHMAGDYFDVDHQNFLLMKKTLLRLESLLSFPCSSSLWLPLTEAPGHMTSVLHNGKFLRFYKFGANKQETPPAIRRCLSSGKVILVSGDSPLTTVLAPVRDSLGDVVAAVEFSSPHPGRLSKNGKLEPSLGVRSGRSYA